MPSVRIAATTQVHFFFSVYPLLTVPLDEFVAPHIWPTLIVSSVLLGEVSGPHGVEYEDGCLLGCCAVSLVEIGRRFRDAYCLHHQRHTTRHNIPEESNLHTLKQTTICHSVLTTD
jgi:hypothetical protein